MPFRHQLLLFVASFAGLVGTACSSDSEQSSNAPTGADSGQEASNDAAPDSSKNEAGADSAEDVALPDVPCFAPDKICEGQCVNYDDPAFGCSANTCEPCPVAPHAESGCVNDECLVVSCEAGWSNCDGNPLNGCETNIWEVANCGDCGVTCALSNGTAVCNEGTCDIGACDTLWADCNANPVDGCETNLRTLDDCGSCGTPCAVPNATCATGTCTINNCPEGTANCDGDETTCETDVTTIADCGACGLACTGPNVDAWTCDLVAGSRACQIAACAAGWLNCDGTQANGCEVSLSSSVDHCGACGASCSGFHVLTRACVNGLCAPTCESGFEDANGPQPGTSDDGCEASL